MDQNWGTARSANSVEPERDILVKELLMDNRFQVEVSAGTMMSASSTVDRFPHRWTPGAVTVEADFTGGHLLHLAAAGCVLNDIYREAAALGIELHRDGVKFHLILNAFWESLDFELPRLDNGANWRRWIDTTLDSPHDIVAWEQAPPIQTEKYHAGPRSVVVLIATGELDATNTARNEGPK